MVDEDYHIRYRIDLDKKGKYWYMMTGVKVILPIP
jgi:hypothetical protein